MMELTILKLDKVHFYPISKEDLEKIPLELLTKKIEEEIGRLKSIAKRTKENYRFP